MPFVAFLVLLATAVVDLFVTWSGFLAVRLILAGGALLWAASAMSRVEQEHLRRTILWATACFVGLALWMFIQLLPLPFLTHPVWQSARDALGGDVSGHISVDLSATFRASAHVFLATAIMVLGAAVAIDRDRAEWSLFALSLSAAAGTGLALARGDLAGGDLHASARIAAVLDCSALGLLLSLASSLLVFERFETRRARQTNPVTRFVAGEAACFAVFVLCTVALVRAGGASYAGVAFAALGGVCIFGILVAIRRFGLGLLTGSGLVLAAFLVCAALADLKNLNGASFLLGYSATPASALESAGRMIQDAPYLGTGAGSFGALASLYYSFADMEAARGDVVAPSTAASLVVEMGRPFALVLVAVVAAGFGLLVRGALTRGRDSVYPIVGAATMVALFLSAFVNVGLSQQTTIILSSAVLGLAMAQRVSRRGS